MLLHFQADIISQKHIKPGKSQQSHKHHETVTNRSQFSHFCC